MKMLIQKLIPNVKKDKNLKGVFKHYLGIFIMFLSYKEVVVGRSKNT